MLCPPKQKPTKLSGIGWYFLQTFIWVAQRHQKTRRGVTPALNIKSSPTVQPSAHKQSQHSREKGSLSLYLNSLSLSLSLSVVSKWDTYLVVKRSLNVSLALCVWFQSATAGLMLNYIFTSHILPPYPFRAHRRVWETWRRRAISTSLPRPRSFHRLLFRYSQQYPSIDLPNSGVFAFVPLSLKLSRPGVPCFDYNFNNTFFIFEELFFSISSFFPQHSGRRFPLWSGFLNSAPFCDFFFSTWCISTGGGPT